MKLKMVKGQEHGLVISERITDRDEFMYPVYRQALDALREIIQQPQQLRMAAAMEATGVYGYLHNIITFSGPRGQGKTSAMVSFSQAMRTGFEGEDLEKEDPLRDCRFTVLPPIDPTILEKDQSILAVVLSRMYRAAEQTWKKSCRDQGFAAHYGHSEAEKNSLLSLFQQCLSGINAIKFREGKEIKSLSGIHEMSDSAVLKDKFKELTRELLHFIGDGCKDGRSYLVIQLDDTDFQIRKGYELLEDVRKYLTIPNVIILMATDMDMLRITLTQHYVQEFEWGLREKIVDVDKLRKIESKYLDKLIPPSYTVYLPHLDDVIHQQGNSLEIEYITPDNKGDPNVLLTPKEKEHAQDYSFQSRILRYVYRKTRIIFAGSESYVHNLIPTTLRGFAQFLGTLSSMEDVPVIIGAEDGKTRELFSPQELADLVDRQVKVLEVNLPLFEHYFLHDWVHTKLSVKKAAALEKLGAASPEERFQVAVEQLQEVYGKEAGEPAAGEAASYSGMVERIQKLRKVHRQMDDFYFFFAIHTFFTIQSHKAVLRQKKVAIAPYLDGGKGAAGPIIFDFSPELTHLPDRYPLHGETVSIGGQKLAAVLDSEEVEWLRKRVGSEKVLRRLLTELGGGRYQFSFLNFITLFLSKGALEDVGLGRDVPLQATLYAVQTSAATVAINWDAQDALQKRIQRLPDGAASNFLAALRIALEQCDDEIQRINARQDEAKPMLCSWLKDIRTLVDRGPQAILSDVVSAVDEAANKDKLNDLCRIYAAAERLNDAMGEDPVNAKKLDVCWSTFVSESKDYTYPQHSKGFDWDTIHPEDIIQDLAVGNVPTADRKVFWGEFQRQMRKLCEIMGYSIAEVKKTLKAEGKS